MATNQVLAYSHDKTRQWLVPAATPAGSPVASISNEPGVTITARGDSTVTFVLADGSTVTRPNAPVGVRADSAVVAVDGSWSFPVIGATAATAKNTLVYLTLSTGLLTLTVNATPALSPKYGVTDSPLGKASATETTVKIGVFA